MSEPGPETPTESPLSLDRLRRLTDVVYALVLLLLLQNLAFFPTGVLPEGGVDGFVDNQIGPWLDYLLTFLIVGHYWVTHQKFSNHYQHTDTGHTYLELIYLMFLTAMPFGNQLMGAQPDAFEGKLFVSLDIIAVGVMQYVIWAYASKNDRLLTPGHLDAADKTKLGLEAMTGPIAATAAIVAALINPDLWVIVLIAGFIAVGVVKPKAKRTAP